jgi:hypothetical protein
MMMEGVEYIILGSSMRISSLENGGREGVEDEAQ